ncbi:DUF1631 family protein [Luteimonas vadosa]|uniref:DUF1631 domain-containing protein n=1 Tax=Luteimonas vadosa TaxID=1165507 RepID=A0ABP9E6H4_9GAMM
MPNPFMQPANTSPAAAERLLGELKTLSVERLAAVPGGLYEPIERQLNEALRLGTQLTPRNDLKLVLAMRQHNAKYVMRYRELVARGFDDFRDRNTAMGSGLPLGLVNESELEFHLAGQRLAEGIARRYQKPLELLERRLDALSTALGLPAATNPVGPVQLTSVFLRTFQDAGVSDSLQPLMFRQYDEELSKVLAELYQRLNSRLAIHGYLAERRRPAFGSSEAAQEAQRAPEATGAESPPAGDTQGKQQELRALMHRWRAANDDAGGSQGDSPAAGDGPRLRAAELSSVAMLIQRDTHPELSRAVADGGSLRLALRHCLLEGTRRFGLDPDRMRLGEDEEDAIDLVGLLFESLVRSEGLAAEGQRLLARLMVPYARIALGDFKLFMQASHPARRFVDAVALSCEDWGEESPQHAELLQRASAAVDRVVAGYNEDLAIFEVATRELQDLLEQNRRRAEVVERRSVETVNGRERLLQARLQAAAALAQRASGVPLSATVFEFLEQQWSHHVVQVILRDGFGCGRHVVALELADELIAIDQAAARCGRGEVVTKVVAVRPRLVECLSSAGIDADGANEWMASLARALAFPDASRVARSLPAVPKLDDDGDDTRLLKAVGGHGALDFDQDTLDRMRALEPGTWLRLTDEAGNETGVKVAWISPLTSRLLLVNRRGVRRLVASPAELAALAKLGRLSTDADHMPFDDALHQVRHRLAATGGTAQAA